MTHEQKECNDFLPPNSHAVLCTLCLLGKSSNTSAPAAAYLLSISIKLLLYQKKVVCQPHFRFFGCSFLWPQSMLLSVSHDNHKDFLQKWISAYVVHSMYLTFLPTYLLTYLHPSSTRWKIQADRPAKVCTTNSPVISCFKCNGVKLWLTIINHQHWQ